MRYFSKYLLVFTIFFCTISLGNISVNSYRITGSKELNIVNDKNYLTHIIKEGDTLSQISQNYYYSAYKVLEIIKIVNGIKNSDSINIGQKIIIPKANYFLKELGIKDALNSTNFIFKKHESSGDLFLGIFVCLEEDENNKNSCSDRNKFLVIRLSSDGKYQEAYDFSYLNDKFWPYASWEFVDLDGDGGIDLLGEWSQGSDNYTMHIAMHLQEKSFYECEVAGEIALGDFHLKTSKNGSAIFEYDPRGYPNKEVNSQEKIVVKWDEIKDNCKKVVNILNI